MHSIYFQKAYNRLVDVLVALPKDAPVPPVFRLAREFGVSRTLIYGALERAKEFELVDKTGEMVLPGRRSKSATGKFTLHTEASSESERVQEEFLRMVRCGQLRPGQYFTEAEIAREADSATVTVREALLALSQSQIITKQARRSWRVVPLTAERIAWATEARLLVECHALKSLFEAPDDNPVWAQLRDLQERHRVYRETPEPKYEEFYELDREFHCTLYRTLKNEYLRAFEEVMSFFVLLQSQGAKLQPNIFFTACSDHLKIIDAILQRRKREAVDLLRDHLERSAAAIQSSLPPEPRSAGATS
jgi:DNA-binding GntR family transcriptional regulator